MELRTMGLIRLLFAAALVTVALGAVLPGRADARIWVVHEDGTGDAPTIAAAMDSAVAGDTRRRIDDADAIADGKQTGPRPPCSS